MDESGLEIRGSVCGHAACGKHIAFVGAEVDLIIGSSGDCPWCSKQGVVPAVINDGDKCREAELGSDWGGI